MVFLPAMTVEVHILIRQSLQDIDAAQQHFLNP